MAEILNAEKEVEINGRRRSSASATGGTLQGVVDGGSSRHPPHLYDFSSVAVSCGDWAQANLHQYHNDGFIVLNGYAPQEMQQVGVAIQRLCSGANPAFTRDVLALYENGSLPDFTAGAKIPWVQYEAGTEIIHYNHDNKRSNVLAPQIAPQVRKLMGFVGYEPSIDAIAKDPQLLSVVARLLGCERTDQVELFQDMALLKPPRGGREKPWHQDAAFFDIDDRVVGCWLAIDHATLHNGCLRFARGQHKDGPRMHFSVRDYQICDSDAPSKEVVVATPLQSGGLVLFDGQIPHGTPTNDSVSPRRALQFHWTKKKKAHPSTAVPANHRVDRTKLYGGAHNGLSC